MRTPPNNDRLLYRVSEAAERLGLGESTLNKLIKQGRLRVVRIDGSVRITREELKDFIQREVN